MDTSQSELLAGRGYYFSSSALCSLRFSLYGLFFYFMFHLFTFILNVLFFISLHVKDDIHVSFT